MPTQTDPTELNSCQIESQLNDYFSFYDWTLKNHIWTFHFIYRKTPINTFWLSILFISDIVKERNSSSERILFDSDNSSWELSNLPSFLHMIVTTSPSTQKMLSNLLWFPTHLLCNFSFEVWTAQKFIFYLSCFY